MKYTLAKPDGTLGNTNDFDVAPTLSTNKGKWLPDDPPTFNPATQIRAHGVQSVGAAAIVYVITPRLVVEVRAEKLAQLESARDKATTTNVTAHGRQWQADERSQKLLSSAITLAMAGVPLPTAWRDVANNNMPITVIGDLVAIAGAMAVQTQAAYVKSWALKADVAAALTPEAVALVVW